jgi:GntR family transcriptional regulator, carbon starvation induced regulator
MNRIVKLTAATAVYERLRRDILNGSLRPGQKLVIDLISDRYGAGLNPVREALNRLSAEGLVERKDQRGFFVPPVSIEGWRDLVRTRCWLESKALEEAIANGDRAWEELIVVAFHHLSRTPWKRSDEDTTTNPDWEERHRAFHLALLSACGSAILVEICGDLMDKAQRYRFISVASHPDRNTVEEHRRIMDAALDRQPGLAIDRLVEHYQTTLRHIEEQIAPWSTIGIDPPLMG